jgi:hypothetical protein
MIILAYHHGPYPGSCQVFANSEGGVERNVLFFHKVLSAAPTGSPIVFATVSRVDNDNGKVPGSSRGRRRCLMHEGVQQEKHHERPSPYRTDKFAVDPPHLRVRNSRAKKAELQGSIKNFRQIGTGEIAPVT